MKMHVGGIVEQMEFIWLKSCNKVGDLEKFVILLCNLVN